MGFSQVFTKQHTMATRLFRQAVLLRLAAPGGSKLAHARRLSKEDGVEVPVHKFYRMMDAVTDERITQLQSIVSREVLDLLQDKLDVLFFDEPLSKPTNLAIFSRNFEDLRLFVLANRLESFRS